MLWDSHIFLNPLQVCGDGVVRKTMGDAKFQDVSKQKVNFKCVLKGQE